MLRNIIRIIRPKLTWLFPADENIWFHRQVAYSMAFWAMVHTTAHYINFINVERTRTFCLALTLALLILSKRSGRSWHFRSIMHSPVALRAILCS